MKLFSLRSLPVATTALCMLLGNNVAAQPAGPQATHPFADSRPIPGRYIVLFKDSVADPRGEAARTVQALGGQLHHAYGAAVKGFAATLPDAALQGIRHHPLVESIEQDRTVSLQQSSPQNQATWGLDRIVQADLPLDTQYQFGQTGAGVTAFIVDTGIRPDHVEFAGRLRPGYSAVADGNGTQDCNGHGTHVAGTVGGTTWGVAKGVALVPVRVLDCSGSGSWSSVIAGVDFVANSSERPAVANMSLGGSLSASVNAAVAGAVAKGVAFAVAAGNNNADACTASPASEPTALTVGASSSLDYRASFSNWGTCVDLFAPGAGITSAWHTSSTATNTIGGTSMASPHVAGVAALVLQSNPAASPAAVADFIKTRATPNRLYSVGTGSPNLLLFSLTGTTQPVEPSTQVVAFKSMSGNSVRQGGNWRASATVAVHNVSTGSPVANATVSGTFSPGGSAKCVTNTAGTCALTSGSIKLSASSSSTFTGSGISGTLVKYDGTQNSVTQIVIPRP
jgi:subtilisin family serine protease